MEYALRASHTVVIYARNPSKLPETIVSNPAVSVIKGELTDREALKSALTDVDAILSVLGPAVRHVSGTPITKAYILLLELMRETNVKRIILLGKRASKTLMIHSGWPIGH